MNNFLLMFLFSIISLVFMRKHILLVLISLEFIILILLLVSIIFCLKYNFTFYIYVMFMTLFVCEGVLGLGLLVNMIRCHGNDYLNSMFLW
uniref:NADH dehydrogenase subunit 4L n=1 Tax=Apphia sp. 1 SJ-2023a TaxID=3040699 RepID=UPI002551DBEC|nr:NADH dehydrogenase subunit 4L [Apphia sp. 1 SJ-2023a]WGC89439.1 NADH dehydrogenase subunit 4L [Apphia sp. 1 SJ-2023a]